MKPIYQRFVASTLLIGAALTAHANLFTDPGFEGAGALLGNNGIFQPYPNFSAGWAATQTDGEVFLTQLGRPAHSGEWYADLLQNPGGNPNTYWDETSFTFGFYDRVTTLVNVSANTTYDFSFFHAGGDRFGYLSGDTLVQIQSMQTGWQMTDRSTTPGLFDWQRRAFQITTDATTTQLAFSFSSISNSSSSALIDTASLTAVPEPATLTALGLGALALLRRKRRA